MRNLEEEIQEWKKLLNSGTIDEETYNNEVTNLIQKHNSQKHQKQVITTFFKNNKTNIKLFFIFFIILVFLLHFFYVDKKYEIVGSFSNIKPPIQTKTNGGTNKIVAGTNVNINYIYKYSISGRVVGTQTYLKYNLENSLSPKDVGISWGFLANDVHNSKVNWNPKGNRFLYWNTSDGIWLRNLGGESAVESSFSNNHLIPHDTNISKLISAINVNDFIKIEGYLVQVNAKMQNSNYTWNSSTSRYDSGNGACEVVYVTDVKWLKEK